MEVVAQSMGFKTHIRNFKVDNIDLITVLFSLLPLMVVINELICCVTFQMRVEGLSADKAGHFSVILEVGSQPQF